MAALDRALSEHGPRVAMVVMTATNNASGGQAVSLENLRRASSSCRAAGVPLVLDACRFAENAWAVRRDERAERGRSLESIAREMLDLCDAFTMSAKMDAIVNTGGMLGVRDPAIAAKIREELVRTEGFPTYGGFAGRDLDAIAQGLHEVLDEAYLEYRFAASEYLAGALERAGWPVIHPTAAHAVYVDAGAGLPQLKRGDLPGQCLRHVPRWRRAVRIVEEPPSLRHFTASLPPSHALTGAYLDNLRPPCALAARACRKACALDAHGHADLPGCSLAPCRSIRQRLRRRRAA